MNFPDAIRKAWGVTKEIAPTREEWAEELANRRKKEVSMNLPVQLSASDAIKVMAHAETIDLGPEIAQVLSKSRINIEKVAVAIRWFFYTEMQDEEYYAKVALKPSDVVAKDGVNRYALIDGEGLVWMYQLDPENDYEDEDMAWVRQSQEMLGGRYLVGPIIERDAEEDWDCLLQYGPLRIATDEDDLSWKFVYATGGYDNGRRVGPEVHLNEEEHNALVAVLYAKEQAEKEALDNG